MSADDLVKKGFIHPRDEKYDERSKTGKLADVEASPAKKNGKKTAK
jgi:hypothetical protein